MSSFTPQQIEEFLQEFFDVVGARQYVGARYVPIFGRAGEDTIEWDGLAPYEPLTVVMHQGVSYVSRRYVPAGIQITDPAYWVETYRFNAQVEQYRQEVLSFQGQIDEIREDFVPFPAELELPKYGTLGQVLTTLADGKTKWEDPVVPSDEQAEEVITAWLDAHPEATTTVQDNSVTNAKLVQTGGILSEVTDARNDGYGNYASLGDCIRSNVLIGEKAIASFTEQSTVNMGTPYIGRIRYSAAGDQVYVAVNWCGTRQLMQCSPNVEYGFEWFDAASSGTARIYVRWYDANKSLIEQVDTGVTMANPIRTRLTSPATAAYAICLLYCSNDVLDTFKFMMFPFTGTWPTDGYVPPIIPTDVTARQATATNAQGIQDANARIDSLILPTFNIDTTEDGWWSYSPSANEVVAYAAHTSFGMGGFIPCVAGEKYSTGLFGGPNAIVRIFVYFRANGQYVSTTGGNLGAGNHQYTFTVPANCDELYVSWYYSTGYPSQPTMAIARGDVWVNQYMPPYVPADLVARQTMLPRTLKICSYNVGLWNNGSGGAVRPNLGIKNDLLRSFFMDENFDFVACQEFSILDIDADTVSTDAISDIYPYWGTLASIQLVGSRYPFYLAKNGTFTANVDGDLRRYMIRSIFVGGIEIGLFNCHPSYNDSEAGRTARQAQYAQAIELMDKFDNAILCGDWNSLDYSEMAIFETAGYTLLNGYYTDSFYTYPALEGSQTPLKLDNVLIKGDHLRGYLRLGPKLYDSEHPTDPDYYISDHIPVIAEITVF